MSAARGLLLKQVRAEEKGEKLLSYSRSGGDVGVFVAGEPLRCRHENFHEDKINLLEPIFDEASSLFLMVAATRQRLQRRGRALGAELTSNSTERGKTL